MDYPQNSSPTKDQQWWNRKMGSFTLFLNLTASFNSDSSQYRNIFPQIHHFLSYQEITTALSLFSVRKLERTQFSKMDFDSGEDEDLDGGRIGRLGLTRSPISFKNCFRMTYSTFEWLTGSLEPLFDCRDPVGFLLNLFC